MCSCHLREIAWTHLELSLLVPTSPASGWWWAPWLVVLGGALPVPEVASLVWLDSAAPPRDASGRVASTKKLLGRSRLPQALHLLCVLLGFLREALAKEERGTSGKCVILLCKRQQIRVQVFQDFVSSHLRYVGTGNCPNSELPTLLTRSVLQEP